MVISPEEYLAADRAEEFRSEYVDGEVFAMSGGSSPHSQLISRVAHELEGLLDDSPCLVSVTELRLQVGRGRAYFYPDVMVMCGKNGADPADMISNPTVVVEVLSPSTELWDRTGKFAFYRQVESLREYVLVSQDAVRVEWFTRGDGGWLYQEAAGAEAVCRLESLDVTLSLGRIYKKWLLSQ